MIRKLLVKIDNKQNYIADDEKAIEITLDNIYRMYADNIGEIGIRHDGHIYSCRIEDMVDKETAESIAAENKERNKAARVAYLKTRLELTMAELKELLK